MMPRPAARRARRVLAPVFLVLALAGSAVTTGTIGCATKSATKVMYHCPMHPTYTSDRPADCPICNMAMVPMAPVGAPAPAATGGSMSDTPGGAGMDDAPVGLDDHAAVHIDPEMARQSGIVTTEVDYGRVVRSFKAVAVIAADEARVRMVEARTAGWVRFLHVAATGRRVSTGDVLLVLESPEMLVAQQEYVAALNSLDRLPPDTAPVLRDNLAALVAAARSRLSLFGLPSASIDDLTRTRQPLVRIPVLAPAPGTVTVKNVSEGQRVDPGMMLFTLADLSRVWIEARVFENDLGSIRPGQTARVTRSADPSWEATATVAQIVPAVDEATRTLVVRLTVPNDDGRLTPGQYAEVAFEQTAETGLVVPESAILDTGTRRLAFVHRADNHYEPREVTLGASGDGQVLVLSGLSAGDHVVSRAAFLVDSESRLRASIARAMAPGHDHGESGQ